MLADGLTKPLEGNAFQVFMKALLGIKKTELDNQWALVSMCLVPKGFVLSRFHVSESWSGNREFERNKKRFR
jgi:hypothetical protein